ncbi:MAG: Z1 domain-containing protein [Malacoplasma sp.]|nr:Z1 domain-containing protein [Malacoplasma sp.]
MFINNQDNQNHILESFKKYLNKKIEDQDERKKILEKGEQIIKDLDGKEKSERKGLLVGHVQSGKTINFISVIVNAFFENYKIIIVLTSLDNKLHGQTVERLKESLEWNKNKNFLKFFEQKSLNNIEESRKVLNKNLDSNYFSIIPILKGPKIDKIREILSSYGFEKEKVLVIDDEGDLASATHSVFKDSKTYKKIESLLETTNSTYLTVTATPLVNILMDKEKSLFPNWVFCIDPGKGYVGINEFTKNQSKYFQIINEKFDNLKKDTPWHNTEEFHEAINYYFLLVTRNLESGAFTEQSHTNMLIHTDVFKIKHDEYNTIVTEYIEAKVGILSKNEDDISYKNYVDYLKKISDKYFDNFKLDKKILERLKFVMKSAQVYLVNSDRNDQAILNGNQCSILIGSRMLERGITLDNLLVTFFTNRAKSISAIDTLLQRARWFGYRKDILDDIKIFTTKKIAEDFKEINAVNNSFWNSLKGAEEYKEPLKNVMYSILCAKKDLIPTSKAPLEITSLISRYYENNVQKFLMKKDEFNNIINVLNNSEEYLRFSKKYFYKKIVLDSDTFFERYKNIISIFIEEDLLNELKKQSHLNNVKVNVVFLDDIDKRNEPRTRGCFPISENSWGIKQIFQGSNANSGEDRFYPGDGNWNNEYGYENTLFLQIHKIKPIYIDYSGNQIENDIDFIYVPVLLIPESIQIKKFTSRAPI